MTHFRWFHLLPATLLVVAGCSSSHKGTTTSPTTTSISGTIGTAAPTTTGATGAGTTTTTAVSAGGPLPAGFTVYDLTWVSDTQGWALGTAPCAQPPCTSVAHTLNGGRTWAGLPAPKAYGLNDPALAIGPGCSATVACVSGIRFADSNIGYAFGSSSLWLTTNGGHAWTERSTDRTDALEVDGTTVVRVTHPTLQDPPGVPYQVQAAAVGTTSWHNLAAPTLIGDAAELAVQGSDLYLAVLGNPAGGAGDEHAQFARSADSGAHWTTFSDPCGVTASGDEADATAITAAPGGNLAVGCTARQAGEAGFVVVSSDAGATFGPHRGNLLSAVPPYEQVQRIAAATGQRLAVLIVGGTTGSISVSSDAGADWTVTQTYTLPTNGPSGIYLGFEDATTGRAVLLPSTVLTTTDGGGHWTPYTFP